VKDKPSNKDIGFIQCPETQETLFSVQIFTDDLTLNEECHNMFTRECEIILAVKSQVGFEHLIQHKLFYIISHIGYISYNG
jgi:hypothetical protein